MKKYKKQIDKHIYIYNIIIKYFVFLQFFEK